MKDLNTQYIKIERNELKDLNVHAPSEDLRMWKPERWSRKREKNIYFDASACFVL